MSHSHPGGQKDSEQGYGTSAGAADDTRQRGYDNTRQQGYDDTRQHGYDNTAAGTTVSHLKDEDNASCLSVKSGVHGPFAGKGADTSTVARDHPPPTDPSYSNRAVYK